MGVLGLTGILKKYAPNAVQTVSASMFARQTIAFDASCHLNKFIYGDEQVPHRHIYGFYQLARFCDLNSITPIFVFDGPQRLQAKEIEHEKRARARRKVKHSLAFEQEQALRLDAWLEVAEALACHKELFPEQDVWEILNDEKVLSISQELLDALKTAEDTEKYTRTVRNLARREGGVITEIEMERLHHVKESLEKLKADNQQMLNSLEKRSFRITQKMRSECQEFLKTLGYVCFSCNNHEAEAMCANLSNHGRTTATVSEDLDTLAFGDAPILRYFFSRGRPILSIDPVIARRDLGLTRASFIDLCILCGTDFSGTISGIGPHRALQWIKKYESIENVLENLHKTTYKPQDTFNYTLARHVFTHLPSIPMHDSDYEPPLIHQFQIDQLLQHYEINPIEVDMKLKSTLLTQNVINKGNSWGSDPFSNNNNTTIEDHALLQFN